jgi:hypothetical protein
MRSARIAAIAVLLISACIASAEYKPPIQGSEKARKRFRSLYDGFPGYFLTGYFGRGGIPL